MSDPSIARLEQANEELRTQSNELAALAGSLAHEIKTLSRSSDSMSN
ncbi:MAG: hypothetical protein R3B96_00045 [Pirellulaceae bacterium]